MSPQFSARYELDSMQTNIEDFRGIQHSDLGVSLIIIENKDSDVSESLLNVFEIDSLVEDAYETTVRNTGSGIIAFQFKGHDWTIVEAPNFQPPQKNPF